MGRLYSTIPITFSHTGAQLALGTVMQPLSLQEGPAHIGNGLRYLYSLRKCVVISRFNWTCCAFYRGDDE